MISACSMRDSVSELFIRTPLEVVGAIKLLVAMLVAMFVAMLLAMLVAMLVEQGLLVKLVAMLVVMLVEQWLLVKLEMVINSVTPDSRLAILLIPLFPGNVENQLQDNI